MKQTVSETLVSIARALVERDDSTPTKTIDATPLGYLPTNWASGVATAVVVLIVLAHTWHLFRYGGRYMLAMVIGGYCYAVGIALRFGVHYNPHSLTLYAVQNAFVTLSPCGFIAAEYVLLGRMARWLGCTEYLLVPAKRITLIFVLSDVSTFLVQGAGGGLAAGSTGSSDLGSKIFLIGLIIQLVSFAIFTSIFLLFIWRVRKYESSVWHKNSRKGLWNDWRILAAALMFSCIGILVRSVYRVIELSEGFRGHLTTTEWYFFVFDVIPLVCAIAIYIPIWPARFFPDGLPPVVSADTLAATENGRHTVEYGRKYPMNRR